MPAPSLDPLGLVEEACRRHFQASPWRASVSFVGVEAIEILRFDEDEAGCSHYLSLGMSRHPMTDPSAVVVDPAGGPRAELMVSAGGRPDELWRLLAILAAAPAVEGAVYQDGNRIDLGQPWVAGSRCTGALVADSELRPIRVTADAQVEVLRLIPATGTELAWARIHGSPALRDRWVAERTELADLMRDPVTLA